MNTWLEHDDLFILKGQIQEGDSSKGIFEEDADRNLYLTISHISLIFAAKENCQLTLTDFIPSTHLQYTSHWYSTPCASPSLQVAAVSS